MTPGIPTTMVVGRLNLGQELGSSMALPLVDGHLAVLYGCEVAVWYSTFQFGGSMVSPHVV